MSNALLSPQTTELETTQTADSRFFNDFNPESSHRIGSLRFSEFQGQILVSALENRELYEKYASIDDALLLPDDYIIMYLAYKNYKNSIMTLVANRHEPILPEGVYWMGENLYKKDKTGFYVKGVNPYGQEEFLTVHPFGNIRAPQASRQAWLSISNDMLMAIGGQTEENDFEEELEGLESASASA